MASFIENTAGKNVYFSRLELEDEEGNEYSDRWNTGELLCLASAVQRSGDKNWVSVSRSIKPYGDPKRPADWYTPKNCALQYSKLLKGVEDFKKKSLPRTERETSEELLVKNLTDKRINELLWLNQATKTLANSLKVYMELIENGEHDDQLDDMIKLIEEQEKKEEEDYKEWIAKREALNAAKKLNKCRVPLSKGKAASRTPDSKRKNSPNLDLLEEASGHSAISDIVIKTEIESDQELPVSKPIYIKQEPIDTPSNISALLEGSKASNTPSSLPTTPTSPLLTSLLRNVPANSGSTPVLSYVSSPLKESEVSDVKSADIDMLALIAKAQETPPRGSVPQSPRPTPASSPLLNSLLKSSPGSVSPLATIQLSQAKDVTPPKAASSPQSFFNPTSALASAAAQQLAVATSALPQAHVFFSQDSNDSQKRPLQSSPSSSACLSAPTLSKLLEMPPSTPGRLPPLPVVEPVNTTVITTPISTSTPISTLAPLSTPEPVASLSPQKAPSADALLNELELQITASSPTKIPPESVVTTEISTIIDQPQEMDVTVPFSVENSPSSNLTEKVVVVEQEVPFKRPSEVDDTSQKNIDFLLSVSESINQAFEKKEMKQEHVDVSNHHSGSPQKTVSEALNSKHGSKAEKVLPDDVLDAALNIEKLISSDMGLDERLFTAEDLRDSSDISLFEDDKPKSDMETDNSTSNIQQITEVMTTDSVEEEKTIGRKFYKSRSTSKKRPSTEDEDDKSADVSPTSKHPPKKSARTVKMEVDGVSQVSVTEHLLAGKEAEPAVPKTPEKSPTKTSDAKSPVAKKPRIYEKAITKEKKELSEDETPVAKRPGRKAKKGRKPKITPIRQDEPKDQYEFSESTEENSVGYQTANTLCYMPRLKEDARFEDSKMKHLQSQSSEENIAAASSTASPEKKRGSPLKNKTGKPSQSSVHKGLFTSDEERMSDSMTSDDASNSHFGEDKLKKWKEYNEKKDELIKNEETTKTSQKTLRGTDTPKRKTLQTKRNVYTSKSDSSKKEKRSIGSDIEESSACSRDSEDAGGSTPWQRDDGEANEAKVTSPALIEDAEEANDSHMSSSMTAESDKPMDEIEGYESLQGSATTDFSPLPQSEMKEEKDLTHFGKQDWFHGASPKSSEPVSQSSEESEYESDNWDNQSVSTNKSTSQSTGKSSRKIRKERESPQYKAWKKAISIVLREASCHKYANVFLQKVTNDVAPGYLNIVYRPMDLSLLKKNVDNGVVKTTDEVHRDMLLMFQNAVMYNSSDHDVHHMAVEMQRDVIQQIQAFLTTQFNDKDESAETTSSLRGARSAKSQKGSSKAKEESHEKD